MRCGILGHLLLMLFSALFARLVAEEICLAAFRKAPNEAELISHARKPWMVERFNARLEGPSASEITKIKELHETASYKLTEYSIDKITEAAMQNSAQRKPAVEKKREEQLSIMWPDISTCTSCR